MLDSSRLQFLLGFLAFRLVFAFAGFARWLRVLNNLKGFESTGKPMLPILQAVPATVPFFFVIFCWFAGFIHLYYCFGLNHWWLSMIALYKLGFLAEAGLDEILLPADADAPTWRLAVDFVVLAAWRETNWTTSPSRPSRPTHDPKAQSCSIILAMEWGRPEHFQLVLFQCFGLPSPQASNYRQGTFSVCEAMSLSMSIILMNVLIGVLAESYNRGDLAATVWHGIVALWCRIV